MRLHKQVDEEIKLPETIEKINGVIHGTFPESCRRTRYVGEDERKKVN